MNINKAAKRDNKLKKRKNGMREDSRSVFTIKQVQKDRAKKIEKARRKKEEIANGDTS